MDFVKKLYFDVGPISTDGGNTVTQRFLCTQATVGSVSRERHGGFMANFAPVAAGTPAELKRKRSVAAWFQLISGSAITSRNPTHAVDFVGAGAQSVNQSPAIGAGGGSAAIPAGHDPIGTRHFMVRLRLIFGGTVTSTARGVLFVQRQHSIEV